MFVHHTHLPQLLAPECYQSSELLDRELDAMFKPAWHCIGTIAELKGDGDYFTTELFDRPLICWRTAGRVQAYLNICCHRLCKLTKATQGNYRERIKCQYHGWEYDANGCPRKIPDATSFRPLSKGQFELTVYPTETVGQLIFVNLQADGPPLREYLGETFYSLCTQWFTADHRPTHTFVDEFECNWKVPIENVLESYHIDTVHPNTFRQFPPAESCSHQFFESGDECIMEYGSYGPHVWKEWFMSKLAGVEPKYNWHHLIRYPHTVVAYSFLVSYIQTIIPLSPTRCRQVFRVFHYPGPRGRLRTCVANALLRGGAAKFVRRVLEEDMSVYSSVQQGMASPVIPYGGLLSAREERIFAFQEHVLKATGAESMSVEHAGQL